jgi:thymidylate kinase
MIVEFVGVPGVGKTTASVATAKLLRARGYPFDQIDDLRFLGSMTRGNLLAEVVRKPGLVASLAYHTSPTRWYTERGMWARLLHRDQVASSLAPSKLVASGVLFGAASLMQRSTIPAHVLTGHLTVPDLVVDLHVPLEVAVERIRGRRDGHPAIEMSDRDAVEFVGGYRAAFDSLLESLSIPVMSIDASDLSPDDLAGLVSDRIGELSDSGGP